MASVVSDEPKIKGIACDESTAVCIGPDGIARVYGDYPAYDDNAYFLQVNCGSSAVKPERREDGASLRWSGSQDAIAVYAVKGTSDGRHTFDLSNWKEGSGGTWQRWFVENGMINFAEAESLNCNTTSTDDQHLENSISVLNHGDKWFISVADNNDILAWSLFDSSGRLLSTAKDLHVPQVEIIRDTGRVDITILRVETSLGTYSRKLIP